MSAKTTKNVIFPLFFTGETPPVAILSGAVEKRRNRSAPTGAPPLTKGTVHIPFIIGKKRGKVKYSGEGAPRREPIFPTKKQGPFSPVRALGATGGPVLPAGDPDGGWQLSLFALLSCGSRPGPPAKAGPHRPSLRCQKRSDPGPDSSLTGLLTAERMGAQPRQKAPLAAMETTGHHSGDQRAPSFCHPLSLRCPPEACGARLRPLFCCPLYKKEQTPYRRLLLRRGDLTSPPSSLFRRPFAPAAFPARRCGSPGRGWRWRSPALPAAGRWGRCGCWRHRGPCRRGRWRPPGSV